MENKLRKIGDIWKAIDDHRINLKMGKNEWRQSFEGVKLALNYVGLELITTKEELDMMEVPVDKKNKKNYAYRKILVSRNGIISCPTQIKSLMSGVSGLLTQDEKNIINDKKSKDQIIYQPKGFANANKKESETINNLDILLNMHSKFDIKHLYENRLSDICYRELMSKNELYFPEQIKTATVEKNGRLTFSACREKLTIYKMRSIIKTGISLICIGKTCEGQIDVVWLFYGEKSLNMLSQFEDKQIFCPQLHLKLKSINKFTLEYNKPEYRFDVGKNQTECERLFICRSEIILSAQKYTLKYLNEDDSQIPGEYHRKEHKSFVFTRDACDTINIIVQKSQEDSYGSVDFMVDGSRIQDKIAGRSFHIRNYAKYPINPDSIDVLQVSNGNIVYVIAMRKFDKNNTIVSTLSSSELMSNSVTFGPKWEKNHSKNKCDLSKLEGIKSYINVCQQAKNIPKLSDQSFYDKIILNNTNIFIKERNEIRKNRQKKYGTQKHKD